MDEVNDVPTEPDLEILEETVEEGNEDEGPDVPDVEVAPPGDVAPYDPLHHYLAEVRKYPFLSREEEVRLAVAFREDGNLDAASRLVLSTLRMVVHLAMEFRNIHLPLMDLIQEGNLGLMQAVKKFDPYRGVRLSTYASWWIRAYIIRFILNNWRQVRIGTTQAQRKLFFNLKKEKERLESLGFEAGPKLIAHHLNVKEREVIEMEQRMGSYDLSLSQPRHADGTETEGDHLRAHDIPADEKMVQEESLTNLRQQISEYSKTLSDRDRDILENRILSEDPKSLAEIGRSYGISRERARQIEERIIKQIRERFSSAYPP
jgi:RNA polymerase sigma-32 factor